MRGEPHGRRIRRGARFKGVRYMKRLLLLLLLLFPCTVFSESTSDESIELLFNTHRSIFVELRDRIHLDLGNNEILQVGENLNRKTEVSADKLNEYILELDKISTERLTAFRAERSNIQTSFLISKSGFVFGGCSSQIMHHQKGKPFIRKWAEPYKLIELEQGWYAHTLCN